MSKVLVENGVYYHKTQNFIFVVKTHFWDCYKSKYRDVKIMKIQYETIDGLQECDAQTMENMKPAFAHIGMIQ